MAFVGCPWSTDATIRNLTGKRLSDIFYTMDFLTGPYYSENGSMAPVPVGKRGFRTGMRGEDAVAKRLVGGTDDVEQGFVSPGSPVIVCIGGC